MDSLIGSAGAGSCCIQSTLVDNGTEVRMPIEMESREETLQQRQWCAWSGIGPGGARVRLGAMQNHTPCNYCGVQGISNYSGDKAFTFAKDWVRIPADTRILGSGGFGPLEWGGGSPPSTERRCES